MFYKDFSQWQWGCTKGDNANSYLPNDYSTMSTPQWMVVCPELFVSSIKKDIKASVNTKLNQGIECFKFTSGISSEFNGNFTNPLKSNGKTVVGNVIIEIYTGKHTPIIKDFIQKSQIIKKLEILRLAKANDNIIIIEQKIYESVFIIKTIQSGDMQVVSFRYLKCKEIYVDIAQDDGSKKGNSVSETNLQNLEHAKLKKT